jgi:hypothetical protein
MGNTLSAVVDRLIDLVYRRDFEYAELQGGWVALFWGLWLVVAKARAFTDDGWTHVGQVAPDRIWGMALVLIGLGQLVSLVMRRYRCRRMFALAAAMVWISLAVLLGMDKVYRLLDGSPRLIGLGEIERGAEEDDDGNDRRVRGVSEKGGKEGGDQQDQHQRIQEKAQKVDNGRLVLGRDGIIGTKLAQPCLGFP